MPVDRALRGRGVRRDSTVARTPRLGEIVSRFAQRVARPAGDDRGRRSAAMEAERLVGLWVEDRNAPEPASRYPGTGPPVRRTVEFLRDGTAVAVADFQPDPCTG